jgi:hypothetical protein
MAGRGVGISVLALFGALWMFNALKFDGAPNWAFYASFAATAGLLLAGIARIISDRKSGVPPQSRATRMGFFVVLALEVAVIFAAVWLLQKRHLEKYILPAISAIVGLHFLPLAKIFRAPLYYATGLAMVAATAAAVVWLKGAQQIICIGYSAGAILWLSALIVAVRR